MRVESICSDGYLPVFTREWGGIEAKCLNQICNSDRCVSSSVAQSSVVMTTWGSSICGKRGGKAFIDASRPDTNQQTISNNGDCPGEKIPCSAATSPDNTICVTQIEKDSGLCPITEIKLMDKTEAENLDSENYKVHAFTDDLSLVYSKTQGDNLPIIGTQIAEDKPCYIPGQF